MVCRVTSLPDLSGWQKRVEKIVAISPVVDLAPLMQTSMNKDLQLTQAEALRESPVHLPAPHCPVTVWVGADERPVFLDQAQALAQAWGCSEVIEPARHHFDVIEGLIESDSPLMREILH